MKGVRLVAATRSLASEFVDHPKMQALDFSAVADAADAAAASVQQWLGALEAAKLPYKAAQGQKVYANLLKIVKEKMHQVEMKLMFLLLFISF